MLNHKDDKYLYSYDVTGTKVDGSKAWRDTYLSFLMESLMEGKGLLEQKDAQATITNCRLAKKKKVEQR